MASEKSAIAGLEILLAGGAGGLGSATAELLEAEGAHVAISSRNHGLRADITKAADRKGLLDAVPKLYGLVVFTGTRRAERSRMRCGNRTRSTTKVRFFWRARRPSG